MPRNQQDSIDRRRFLKGAASASAAALAAETKAVPAQQTEPSHPSAAVPGAAQLRNENSEPMPAAEALTTDRPGSDFMVTVLKSLGFEYVAANPGSSFRSLHESLVNFGGNVKPELLTCCHEESSVAMGDGYARIEGKPLAVMAHSTVGLQHASMAIYNAYAGRVPVFLVLGNTVDMTLRRNLGDWDHSAQDAVAMVRDYTKWDDTPSSLTQFAESAVRAYRIALTPPMGPVVLVADSGLQEAPVSDQARFPIPKLTLMSPPVGDAAAVDEMARLLVTAEMPVIAAERAVHTAGGMKLLVELAELLQAPVTQGKFPTDHPLSHPDGKLIGEADVVLGMEVNDLWGTVHAYRDQLNGGAKSLTKAGTKLLSISPNELYIKSNYQNFQRFADMDLAIAADAEATMPALIEACKRQVNSARKNSIAERGRKLAERHAQGQDEARRSAAVAWDASPVSWQRLWAEVWELIKDQDWALVGGQPSRLWKIDRYYQTMGVTGSGGAGGVGYTAPASVGAALAHRKYGRLCVSLQSDGDLMYAPGVLWTAAHHRIPLLMVMHNNRAYHQEVMHVQRMANRHQRGIDNARIGTSLTNPEIDFTAIARGMGVQSEGPITDPKDLAAALRRGIEVVKRGEPMLIDVITQPR